MKKLGIKACQRHGAMMKRKRTSKEEVKNWLDLPRDVMVLIFMKLGAIEILLTAQKVCSSWRKLAQEPCLYRSLEVHEDTEKSFPCYRHFKKFSKQLVDISCGQLETLYCNCDLFTQEILPNVVGQTNPLKSLRLGTRSPMSECVWTEVVQGLPLLEELEGFFLCFPKMLLEEVARSCPKLKYLCLNFQQWALRKDFHGEAVLLAEKLPQLQKLQIMGIMVTNHGLQAILDGFPNLEHLDLEQCSSTVLKPDLLERIFNRIRNVQLPNLPCCEHCPFVHAASSSASAVSSSSSSSSEESDVDSFSPESNGGY